MHAATIEQHQRLQHEANEVVTAWADTDPMTSEEQVRAALEAVSDPNAFVDARSFAALLPYVVDACRERGLLTCADCGAPPTTTGACSVGGQ